MMLIETNFQISNTSSVDRSECPFENSLKEKSLNEQFITPIVETFVMISILIVSNHSNHYNEVVGNILACIGGFHVTS